jgi:hypothetical protein
MLHHDRLKLEALADWEGCRSVDELIALAASDSVCPGICIDCGQAQRVEPDQDCGWCEMCFRSNVKSALVLAGLI